VSNIISLNLSRLPTFEELERESEAQEAAEAVQHSNEYDPTSIKHRALAINGALNTFDFVDLTGVEYWSVYGSRPGQYTFYAWALRAQKTIANIVATFPGRAKIMPDLLTITVEAYACDPAQAQHLDELIAELRDRGVTPRPHSILHYARELGLSDTAATTLATLFEHRLSLGS
jgi:hypothetical protein